MSKKHDPKTYRQAIETAFKVNSQGQQSIFAKSAGDAVRMPWDYELDVADNHAQAAQLLMDKLGWGEQILGGCLKSGNYAWVLIPKGRSV